MYTALQASVILVEATNMMHPISFQNLKYVTFSLLPLHLLFVLFCIPGSRVQVPVQARPSLYRALSSAIVRNEFLVGDF